MIEAQVREGSADDFWYIEVPVERRFLWWTWYDWREIQTMVGLDSVKTHCDKYGIVVKKITGHSLYKHHIDGLIRGDQHGNYVFS